MTASLMTDVPLAWGGTTVRSESFYASIGVSANTGIVLVVFFWYSA